MKSMFLLTLGRHHEALKSSSPLALAKKKNATYSFILKGNKDDKSNFVLNVNINQKKTISILKENASASRFNIKENKNPLEFYIAHHGVLVFLKKVK